MFNIGGGELLIIFLVALVVLGPAKLPEAARQVGKVMGEFRKLSAGFQTEMRQAMNDPVTHAVKKAEAADATVIEATGDEHRDDAREDVEPEDTAKALDSAVEDADEPAPEVSAEAPTEAPADDDVAAPVDPPMFGDR